MTTPIRAATVYKATIPHTNEEVLAFISQPSAGFRPPMSLERQSIGFVEVAEHDGLLREFEGGFAFRVRCDEKIIPGQVVDERLKAAVKKFHALNGKPPSKATRREMKEQIEVELLQVALVKTAFSITCYYTPANGYLIVPTTSKRVADACVSHLIHTIGSIKTETLNFSEPKHGLTARMRDWLDDKDEPFGPLVLHGTVTLQQGKDRVAVKAESLKTAHKTIDESLGFGRKVVSAGFMDTEGNTFTLTKDYRLAAITLADADEIDDEDEDVWMLEAQAGVEFVGNTMRALIELLAANEVPESESADSEEGTAE